MRSDILDTMKNENKKINESIQQILLRLKSLEQANEDLKVENRQLKEEMEDLKFGQKNTLLQTADELHARSLRVSNLILFGVPENSSGTIEDRKNHDTKFCETMFQELGIDENFDDLYRIGKLKPGSIRPLRLKCESVDQKRRILRSSKALKDNPEYRSVFVNPDRTPMQLENDKNLREELKRQRLDGNDVIIFRGKIIERSSRKNF